MDSGGGCRNCFRSCPDRRAVAFWNFSAVPGGTQLVIWDAVFLLRSAFGRGQRTQCFFAPRNCGMVLGPPRIGACGCLSQHAPGNCLGQLDAPRAALNIRNLVRMSLAKMLKMRTVFSLLAFALLAPFASAHVGSPDVYYQGQAGPYTFLVIIRPPAVIPGVAEIEVRSLSAGVNRVEILPLRMVGPGADLPPTPDVAQHLDGSKVFYGKLWIMDRCSWKVQITDDGDQGKAEMAVPVAAVSTTSLHMQATLGILLGLLGLLLVLGLVGINKSPKRP